MEMYKEAVVCRGKVFAIALMVGCLALVIESMGGQLDRLARIAQAYGVMPADPRPGGGPLWLTCPFDDAKDDAPDNSQLARL